MLNKQPTVYAFGTKEEVGSGLANFVLAAQVAALSRHTQFKVAVSGGSLPAILASPDLIEQADWSKWVIFFADERCVPLDDPDSNYGLLKKELLDNIPASRGTPTVIPISTENLDDTQEIADQYEQQLVKVFAAKDSVKLPIFDLMLLGCGPDGHTCSLFPGHELLREDVAWVAPIEDSPKPPSKRITLTLPVVTHSSKIAFVALGAGKKEIMKQIFEGEDSGLPCALINRAAGDKVYWFCDNAAVDGVAAGMRRGSL